MDDRMSLANLGRGAAIEKFDHELGRVLENCLDVNAPAEKERKVILTVVFKPDKARESAKVKISARAVLADVESFDSQMFLGRTKRGEARGTEYNPQQMGMLQEPDPEPNGKVTPIKGREVAE